MLHQTICKERPPYRHASLYKAFLLFGTSFFSDRKIKHLLGNINHRIEGVRAIKLAEGDEVVGVCICREGGTVLTVTENGKGRRSEIDTYRITARGGKGIRNYDASKDKVAAVKIVDDVDDILLSSQEGIIIRFHADSIPVQSRYGSGVRVMRLGESDKVMVLARTDHDDEAQTAAIEAEEGDEPTAEQLAAMEAADEASAAETPEADPEN